MLDDAADVVESHLGESGVAFTGEEVLLAFPDRLVAMHTGTVVADDRLGHKRGRLTVSCGDVMNRVFQAHHPVGALDQRSEPGADFILTGGRHFVMVHFNVDAHLFECRCDRRTDVLQRVNGGDRKVAALD